MVAYSPLQYQSLAVGMNSAGSSARSSGDQMITYLPTVDRFRVVGGVAVFSVDHRREAPLDPVAPALLGWTRHSDASRNELGSSQRLDPSQHGAVWIVSGPN